MALIASGTLKGKCPICGAQNCACTSRGATTVIPVDERMEVAKVGNLITIDLRPGVGIKVTEETARSLGLLPKKAKKQSANNKREPAENKAAKAKEKGDGGKAGS